SRPAPSPLLGPRQVLKLPLRPVPPDGHAALATFGPTLPLPGICLAGRDLDVPEQICKTGLQPTIAISYAGGLPAIWSVEPIKPANPLYCFGSQLDTKANNVTPAISQTPPTWPGAWEGIATATADMNGNASTSQPIRVYLDDYGYGGAANINSGWCSQPIPAGAGAPPSCTGTYDKVKDVVSQTACKS